MNFDLRIKKVQKLLKQSKKQAVIISSHAQISYLTGYSNFSIMEQEALLFITRDKNYLITDGRYSEAVKKDVPHFELIEIVAGTSFAKCLQNLARQHDLRQICFEGNHLTFLEYVSFSKLINNLKNIDVNKIRLIKDNLELDLIKKACQIGDLAFEYILKKIKDGMSELDLALELEMFIRRENGTLSFASIVAFGSNSSIPHHGSGEKRLNNQEIVLLDFGAKFQNYSSDMTRTVVFGKASKKQKDIYNTVLHAQQKAFLYINKLLKTNVKIEARKVDKEARTFIISKGYPSIPHSLGHGIGIEGHELPRLSPGSKDILEEGMVFSIEPGIYIPGFGGVRIEDLYTIKNNKLIVLTKAPKKKLIEIKG